MMESGTTRRQLLVGAGATIGLGVIGVGFAQEAQAAPSGRELATPDDRGVAVVLGVSGSRAAVQVRARTGRTLRVPMRDFGGIPLNAGDLVGIDALGGTLVARPYLNGDANGKLWTVNRDGTRTQLASK